MGLSRAYSLNMAIIIRLFFIMFAYVSCIASYRMRTMRGNVMMSQLVLKNVPQNNPVNVPQNDPQNVPKNVPNHVFIFGLGYTGLALVSCIKRKYPGIVRLLCKYPYSNLSSFSRHGHNFNLIIDYKDTRYYSFNILECMI